MVRSEGGQGAAVLCSGGLDSAVLLADVARREAGNSIFPIYVSVGLAWEQEELAMLGRLLRTPPFRDVQPVETLHFDMRDVYPPAHWAIRGEPPGFDTPDEDVYLEGRNIVLLTKAAVFMARAGTRAGVYRAARRQSVSGCHARVLRRDGARAVARPGHVNRDRRAVCRACTKPT